MDNQISVEWETITGVFDRSPVFPIMLKYWNTREDWMLLVSIPLKLVKLAYSPQPQKSKYYTLLPISGDPGVNWGPIGAFTTASLHTASREGQSRDMAIHIKLPSCFGSSKQPKTELIKEQVLARGPL